MLKFVREYKSTYDFQRIDFEADLQSLHTEVRRCIASLYPDDFGTPKCLFPFLHHYGLVFFEIVFVE